MATRALRSLLDRASDIASRFVSIVSGRNRLSITRDGPTRPQMEHELRSAGRIQQSSILAGTKARFLQIADDYGWINPHLRIRVAWNGVVEVDREPSDPAWRKWLP